MSVPKQLKNSCPDINPLPKGLVSVKMILDEIKRQIILNFFPFLRANPPLVAASSSADQAGNQD